MKKFYLTRASLALLAIFAMSSASQAQVTIQVGNGTSVTAQFDTGPTVFGTYYHDNKNQILYTASELSAAGMLPGNILSIAYEVQTVGFVSPGNSVIAGFEVSLKHTTQTNVSNFSTGGFTTVYSGNVTPVTGWTTLTFSTPFFWNGTDNILVQTCFDNGSYNANSLMYYHNTTNPQNGYGYSDSYNGGFYTQPCINEPYSYNTVQRPNTRFTVQPPYANDAGVAVIDSPYMPACTLANTVYVTLENMGTSTLTSATINWSVNGLNLTPVSWTGSIATAQSTTVPVYVGAYGFSNGDVLTVWTSNPNGVTDSLTNNDTLSRTLGTALGGTYAIGGIGADYPSFGAAVSDLALRGVCSAITFNVANGSYNEQISIPELLGSSSTNTVTFKSLNNSSSLVELTYAGTSADNYVVRLDGADYITFDAMTMTNTNTSYGTVLKLQNGSVNNTVMNAVVRDSSFTSTSSNSDLITSTGLNHNFTVKNSTLRGGARSVYFYGNSTASRVQNLVVDNNFLDRPYYMGVYSYYSNGTKVTNNILENNAAYGYGFNSVYLSYDNGPYDISYNRFNVRPSISSYQYGIYMNYAEAPNNNRGRISNNAIIMGDTNMSSYHYAIYSWYGTNFDVEHNSIHMMSTTTSTSYGVYNYGGGGMTFRNNNIVNGTNGGYGIYTTNSYVVASDHNNVYTPNSNFGYYNALQSTLADWQSASGFDMNSFEVNPNFYGTTVLHPCNDTIDNKGMALGYMTDLQGDARHMSNPDIGATEFVAGYPDLGPDTSVCAGTPLTLGVYGPNFTSFTWNTADTTATIIATFPSTYIVSATSHCGITGNDTIEVFHIDDPIADFSMNQSFLTGMFTNLSLSGGTYMWDFGNGATSTDMNPTHVFPNSGVHTVTLYVYNECGMDSITKQVNLQIIGLEEETAAGAAGVFPNPGNGNFTLSLSGMEGEEVRVSVTDLGGRTLKYTSYDVASGNFTVNLSMQDVLTPGLYMVRVENSRGSLVRKLVVQ